MRCTVAHHFKPFRRILGYDLDQSSVLKRCREIHNDPVHFSRDRILSKSAADRRSHILNTAARLILPYGAVRQFNANSHLVFLPRKKNFTFLPYMKDALVSPRTPGMDRSVPPGLQRKIPEHAKNTRPAKGRVLYPWFHPNSISPSAYVPGT